MTKISFNVSNGLEDFMNCINSLVRILRMFSCTLYIQKLCKYLSFYFCFQGDIGNTGRSRPRPGDDQPHVGKYRLIKTIGKGNFAKVKLAKHIPTSKEVRYSPVTHEFMFLLMFLLMYVSSFTRQTNSNQRGGKILMNNPCPN